VKLFFSALEHTHIFTEIFFLEHTAESHVTHPALMALTSSMLDDLSSVSHKLVSNLSISLLFA